MRISNVSQYLGGALDVIAREVIDGDQFEYPFRRADMDFSTATFDADYELFTATVTKTGSKVKIDDLTKVAGVATTSIDEATIITEKLDGSFKMRVPSNVLSQFAGTHTPSPDTTTPFIVAQKLQITIGSNPATAEIRTIRFLWVMRYAPNA